VVEELQRLKEFLLGAERENMININFSLTQVAQDLQKLRIILLSQQIIITTTIMMELLVLIFYEKFR